MSPECRDEAGVDGLGKKFTVMEISICKDDEQHHNSISGLSADESPNDFGKNH